MVQCQIFLCIYENLFVKANMVATPQKWSECPDLFRFFLGIFTAGKNEILDRLLSQASAKLPTPDDELNLLTSSCIDPIVMSLCLYCFPLHIIVSISIESSLTIFC